MTYFVGQTVPINMGAITQAEITAAPSGSKLVGSKLAVQQWTPGVHVFKFTPDVSGIYVLDSGQTVSVAEKLTHSIGASPSIAILTIYIDAGVVIGTSLTDPPALVTPAIASSHGRGRIACQDSGVLAAVSAFTGKNASWIASTGLPALQSAWTAALSNPAPVVPSEDPTAAALQQAGWNKS